MKTLALKVCLACGETAAVTACMQFWAQLSEEQLANKKTSNFLLKKFSERDESCFLTVSNITLALLFKYLEVFTEVLFSTSVQCLCLYFFLRPPVLFTVSIFLLSKGKNEHYCLVWLKMKAGF